MDKVLILVVSLVETPIDGFSATSGTEGFSKTLVVLFIHVLSSHLGTGVALA